MTNQKLITLLVISLVVGVAQCWALYYFLGLELAERRSMTVAISFFGIIAGWPPLAAFYAMAPVSKKTRWRGMMRSLISIFGGTAGLSAEARSVAWTGISLGGVFVTVLLSFLPFTSNKVGSEH